MSCHVEHYKAVDYIFSELKLVDIYVIDVFPQNKWIVHRDLDKKFCYFATPLYSFYVACYMSYNPV